MKKLITLAIGSVLGLALLSGLVQAQTTTADPQNGTTAVVPPFARPNLPEEVQKMLTALQDARKAFLDKQKTALAGLKGATQEQRAAIRETLSANREAFLEAQKGRREQLQTRLEELRKAFAESRLKVIEQIRDQAGARPRKGGN